MDRAHQPRVLSRSDQHCFTRTDDMHRADLFHSMESLEQFGRSPGVPVVRARRNGRHCAIHRPSSHSPNQTHDFCVTGSFPRCAYMRPTTGKRHTRQNDHLERTIPNPKVQTAMHWDKDEWCVVSSSRESSAMSWHTIVC